MKARFQTKLAERKEKGGLRSLSLFDGYADFFSNDYLGLAAQPGPLVHTGSTGSRLISGHSKGAEETEKFLADFFGADAALVFNSGYDANIGLFSSVPQKGDTVLYDELIHASVRDGIRLSHAKAFSFRHNDLDDLRKKAAQAGGTLFVAVESLYSMDGDMAPLDDLSAWCDMNGALLIVDEAHSGGVFGAKGEGLMTAKGLRCFARLITFGKAYGTHGAVVLGSAELREYLYNFARSFIYTTALPEQQYRHIAASVVSASDDLRLRLRENIALFRSLAEGLPFISDAGSPIQVLPFGDIEECVRFASRLQETRIAVKAILPPTVRQNGQRLRICMHAQNSDEEIRRLCHLLREGYPAMT